MGTHNKMVQMGGWPAGINLVTGTFSTTLASGGTTQATAVQMGADNHIISSNVAGAGVLLIADGGRQLVLNTSANALLVYPPVGGTINALAVNTAFSLPAGKAAEFVSGNGVTFIAMLSA